MRDESCASLRTFDSDSDRPQDSVRVIDSHACDTYYRALFKAERSITRYSNDGFEFFIDKYRGKYSSWTL